MFIIVHAKSKNGRTVYLSGYNEEGRKKKYTQANEMYLQMYSFFEIGDTLKKARGSQIFELHKKDTTLLFHYICPE
jgi:hypothetical protein